MDLSAIPARLISGSEKRVRDRGSGLVAVSKRDRRRPSSFGEKRGGVGWGKFRRTKMVFMKKMIRKLNKIVIWIRVRLVYAVDKKHVGA